MNIFPKKKFDYTRVFFRRPFWTYLNILFLKFLVVSAILLLTLTYASVRFYNRYPEHRIQYRIKQKYISRVVRFYQNGPVLLPTSGSQSPPTERTGFPETFHPDASASLDFEEFHDLIENTVEEKSGLSGKVKTVEKAVSRSVQTSNQSLVALLNTPYQTSLNVRNAIENIPALLLPEPPRRYESLAPFQPQGPAYESNLDDLAKVETSELGIPQPEFTDFEVVTGLRNYEKTISIANGNKKLIRNCVDRLYRNDPTFRGNIVVKFDIHPKGYVIPESIKVVESDIHDARVVRCIKRTIKRWRNFPAVAFEMGEYSITQKYIF